MNQQDIEQEICRQRLIDYVMAYGGHEEKQAIAYLDQNCPMWRCANPPKAGAIEVKESGDGNE